MHEKAQIYREFLPPPPPNKKIMHMGFEAILFLMMKIKIHIKRIMENYSGIQFLRVFQEQETNDIFKCFKRFKF